MKIILMSVLLIVVSICSSFGQEKFNHEGCLSKKITIVEGFVSREGQIVQKISRHPKGSGPDNFYLKFHYLAFSISGPNLTDPSGIIYPCKLDPEFSDDLEWHWEEINGRLSKGKSVIVKGRFNQSTGVLFINWIKIGNKEFPN